MRRSFSHKFVALLVIVIGLFTTNISPATAQYGGSYANVSAPPYPGYDTPETKLSGTKCAAGGYASSTGSPIVEAKLYLNDELVKSWAVPTGQTNYGIGVYSQYDSTHFNDGTVIVVKMTVKLTDGKTFQDTGTIGTVYNRAVAYGVYFEDEDTGLFVGNGVPIAAAHLRTMKHTVEEHSDLAIGWWEKDTLLSAIAPSTAVHLSTHGTSAPSLYLPFSEDQYVFPNEITRSSGVPQRNITLTLACCISASNGPNANDLADAFLAGGTGINQASIDFRETIYASQFAQFADAFWGALANGKTAHEARDAMCIAIFGAPVDQDGDGDLDNLPNDHARCWGDYYATLHRLYTGSDQPASAIWHN